MGVVWAAVNESISREVALKLILHSNEELRRRLLREGRACGSLKQRNIVEIYDVGETAEGEPFLVMQLLSGETLADVLQRQRRLEPAQAARIARDVGLALVAAHGAGIVHRDLKPANIFLHEEAGPDGDPIKIVKVLDFGVSKNIGGEASDGLATATGGLVGSPAYMSPEQAKAQRHIDHRSDIWSLGVVLFEALTGVRPFQGDANQLLPKIAFGPILSVSDCIRHVDPGLVKIVARCMERDLAQRVQTAAELVELLKPHSDGSGGAAPRAAAFQPPPAPMLDPLRQSYPRESGPEATAPIAPSMAMPTPQPGFPRVEPPTMAMPTPRPGASPMEPPSMAMPTPRPGVPRVEPNGAADDDAATARIDPKVLVGLARPAAVTATPETESGGTEKIVGPPPVASPVAPWRQKAPSGNGTGNAPPMMPAKGTIKMSPEQARQVASPFSPASQSGGGGGSWPFMPAMPVPAASPGAASTTAPLTAQPYPPLGGTDSQPSSLRVAEPQPRRSAMLIVAAVMAVLAIAILLIVLHLRRQQGEIGIAAPAGTATSLPSPAAEPTTSPGAETTATATATATIATATATSVAEPPPSASASAAPQVDRGSPAAASQGHAAASAQPSVGTSSGGAGTRQPNKTPTPKTGPSQPIGNKKPFRPGGI